MWTLSSPEWAKRPALLFHLPAPSGRIGRWGLQILCQEADALLDRAPFPAWRGA